MIVPASLADWTVAFVLLSSFIALGVFLARWAFPPEARGEAEGASDSRSDVVSLSHVTEGATTPSEYFTIHGEVRNSIARLSLGGELDLDNAAKLEECLELLLRDEHVDATILDLRSLRFIDFAGFRTVVRASDDAARLGRSFVVVNPTDSARRLFELCRADRLLDHDTGINLLEAFSEASSPVHAA